MSHNMDKSVQKYKHSKNPILWSPEVQSASRSTKCIQKYKLRPEVQSASRSVQLEKYNVFCQSRSTKGVKKNFSSLEVQRVSRSTKSVQKYKECPEVFNLKKKKCFCAKKGKWSSQCIALSQLATAASQLRRQNQVGDNTRKCSLQIFNLLNFSSESLITLFQSSFLLFILQSLQRNNLSAQKYS